MKRIFVFIVSALFVISIYAQEKAEVNVPKEVKAAFTKLYPSAQDVKWSEEEDEEFEAEFTFNGKDISVVLDKEGTLKETETKIEVSELPQSIRDFVKKNYPDFKLTEAASIEVIGAMMSYEAEISKDGTHKDLLFTKEGQLIKKKAKEEMEEDEDED